MKNKTFLTICGLLLVAACGPAPQGSTPDKSAATAPQATKILPEYDSTGVISAVDGLTLTIDHDGASAAGVPAGRDAFVGFADVLSGAPLTPGSRVAFKFRKNGEALELSELKAR
jgi:hypothetical protein